MKEEGLLRRILFISPISSGFCGHSVVSSDALPRHFEEVWPSLKSCVAVAPVGANHVSIKLKSVELGGVGKRLQVGYAGNLLEGQDEELVVELKRLRPQFNSQIAGDTHAGPLSWQGCPNLPANFTNRFRRTSQSRLPAFDVAPLSNKRIVRLEWRSCDAGRLAFPLKLFEYMAAGRAIICSDVSVLQEVADEGISILGCRHDDAIDWASALDRLHSNPNLRKSLGEVARRQLESLYRWDRRASFLLNLVPVSGKS